MSNSIATGVAFADPSFQSLALTGKTSADVTLSAVDMVSGAYNLTDFTVRPGVTWANTVAALVGAANSRTASVAGGNIFGCYAQTSVKNATNTISGLNTAIYGVCDLGASTSVGTCFVATLDFTCFDGSAVRASRPTAFIGFGDENQNSLGVQNLFSIGTPGKTVNTDLAKTSGTVTPSAGGSLRVLVNGNIRFIALNTAGA